MSSLPYSLPHPLLSLTPNGHLSLNAERVKTEPSLLTISPVTTTARTQLLSMDQSLTQDSNTLTQVTLPKSKPAPSGHPSLDARTEELKSLMSSLVMTTTSTQSHTMDPSCKPLPISLTHGHPLPSAPPELLSPLMNSLAMVPTLTHILMMEPSFNLMLKPLSDLKSSAKTQSSETQFPAILMISMISPTQRTSWVRPKSKLLLEAQTLSEESE